VPSPSSSPEITPAPEATSPWKVDVVNADQPMIISITTDRGGYAWLIPPNARMVLRDLPTTPNEGTIELVGAGADCHLFDTAALLRTSFTITVRRSSAVPATFALELTPGANLPGPPSTDYEGGCSG